MTLMLLPVVLQAPVILEDELYSPLGLQELSHTVPESTAPLDTGEDHSRLDSEELAGNGHKGSEIGALAADTVVQLAADMRPCHGPETAEEVVVEVEGEEAHIL